MDFDLRQWLLILGPVFIIGVLLHGYLRMRAGQNEIRMKLDKSFISNPGEDINHDDLSLLKAELPNGGARVINADEEEADVPVLMESVELPRIQATDSLEDMEPEAEIQAPVEQEDESPASSYVETVVEAMEAEGAPVAEDTQVDPVAEETAAEEAAIAKAPPARKQQEASESSAPPKPEKFVVINILALDEPFPGQSLLEILMDAEMTFGEMNIFHSLDKSGNPEFSLASAVEPGTFDMKELATFSTPGVTLFMRVHELPDPLRVLDDMLNVAESIAHDLNGEVRDETRSVMTPQTVEHCRQSVREFQFKHSA